MAVDDRERPARQDEVDRIVAAWRRERPDLDVEPLTVLSRVTRLARHLDLARRASFARHQLEPWEFDVLSALRRRVRRGPSPADRRGVLVRLTEEGRARVDAAMSDLLDVEAGLLAGLGTPRPAPPPHLLRDVVAPFDAA